MALEENVHSKFFKEVYVMNIDDDFISLEETSQIDCPWCGEMNSIFIDSSVMDQEYIEDCHVCCKPIEFHVQVDPFRVFVKQS